MPRGGDGGPAPPTGPARGLTSNSTANSYLSKSWTYQHFPNHLQKSGGEGRTLPPAHQAPGAWARPATPTPRPWQPSEGRARSQGPAASGSPTWCPPCWTPAGTSRCPRSCCSPRTGGGRGGGVTALHRKSPPHAHRKWFPPGAFREGTHPATAPRPPEAGGPHLDERLVLLLQPRHPQLLVPRPRVRLEQRQLSHHPPGRLVRHLGRGMAEAGSGVKPNNQTGSGGSQAAMFIEGKSAGGGGRK